MAYKAWEGGLILKNSLFPTKLHQIEGSNRIADSLREDEGTSLKITQRLRIDPSKLEDVTRRMNVALDPKLVKTVPRPERWDEPFGVMSEIDNITEFEELAARGEDAPTAISLLD